jgi:hypothetical protein
MRIRTSASSVSHRIPRKNSSDTQPGSTRQLHCLRYLSIAGLAKSESETRTFDDSGLTSMEVACEETRTSDALIVDRRRNLLMINSHDALVDPTDIILISDAIQQIGDPTSTSRAADQSHRSGPAAVSLMPSCYKPSPPSTPRSQDRCHLYPWDGCSNAGRRS